MLQNFIRNCRIHEIKSSTSMAKITQSKLSLLSNLSKSIVSLSPRSFALSAYLSSPTPSPQVTDGEKRIRDILERTFPNAANIKVQDVSGGCGSMYTVGVQTKEFKGLPIIKQHRLVHEALKKEIKDMHGIQINTSP